MKHSPAAFTLSLLLAGLSPTLLRAEPIEDVNEEITSADSIREEAPSAPELLPAKTIRYTKVEKELEASSEANSASGEEAVIETSHQYMLPRLFTLPTAYSLQSYELRFGGQGNIHSTLSNMSTEYIRGSLSIGLGGIMELGYQLDEYYTVQDISDKMLMGYFKLSLLKESRFLPAASISASKNLRSSFRPNDSSVYAMNEDQYEAVLSKAFIVGGLQISIHPGVQIIRDEVTSIQNVALTESNRGTKINPRVGFSWQSIHHARTQFMYEFKILHPTDVSKLDGVSIHTNEAMENNLGVRFYLRNWLCIDSGIRHYYDMNTKEDEMKLHANFVGVIPLASVYNRIQNYFKN